MRPLHPSPSLLEHHMVLITERSLCTVNIRNGMELARKTALICTRPPPLSKIFVFVSIREPSNLCLFINPTVSVLTSSATSPAFVQCHHLILSSLDHSEDFKSYVLIIELIELYMTQYEYNIQHSATAKYLTPCVAVKIFNHTLNKIYLFEKQIVYDNRL